MEMVLPPRATPSPALSMASLSSPQSTPEWRQKRASSDRITATGRLGEMRASGTQRWLMGVPPSRWPSIRVEVGGSTQR
jgi:hypothetical protein